MTKCLLCHSANNDELLLGKMHSRRHGCVAVHENCLYLSSNLVQRGSETSNDICCFTLADIKIESQRTQKLKCFYCHKNGANIGCCAKKCHRSFHTECGIKNGAQNQYCNTYNSFCSSHIKKIAQRPKDQEECAICLDTLLKKEKFKYTEHILGTCCNRGWYHKRCLQQYANSAGYFFKCPLCNDKEQFHLVSMWGIFVPNRDASWEQTGAYDDQQVLATSCTAENCQLRRENPDESVSEILLYCNLCGGNPMHTQCTPLDTEDYYCNDCNGVANDTIDLKLDDTLIPTETATNLNGSRMKFETMELSMKKEENAPSITSLRPRNCSPSVEHQDSRFRDRNICMTTTDMKGEEKNNENIFLALSQPMTPVSLRSKRGPITVDELEKENSSAILRDQRLGHAMQAALEPKFKNEDQLSDSDIGDDLEIVVATLKKQEEESRKANQLKYEQMPVSDQRSCHGDQASLESKSEIKDELNDSEMGDDLEIVVAMLNQKKAEADAAREALKGDMQWEEDKENNPLTSNTTATQRPSISVEKSTQSSETAIEMRETRSRSRRRLSQDINVKHVESQPENITVRSRLSCRLPQNPNDELIQAQPAMATVPPTRSRLSCRLFPDVNVDHIESQAEKNTVRPSRLRSRLSCRLPQNPNDELIQAQAAKATVPPTRSKLSCDVNVNHIESQAEKDNVRQTRSRSRLSCRLSQNPNDEHIQTQPENATVPPTRSDVNVDHIESQAKKDNVRQTRSRQRRASIAVQPQQCETMRQTRSRSRLRGSPKDANNVPQPTANRAARLRQRRSTFAVERSAKEKSRSPSLKRQTRSRSALKRKSPTDLGVGRHPMRRRSQHALQPEAMLKSYDVEEQWRSRL
ncbi:histone-lysine N-methyltransferase 2C isoform X2 [Drosophila albomicans]|uniref:Histone-lysine N-methyltransferase 2C isoform X2 n=1 Tax=Drosophila albomicans TaxID=7291 RepID=A0A9C6T0C2_DROAB|nr:histone-lysine N-methyltransferase 2C isoform X2 [Drosophila albomicans]